MNHLVVLKWHRRLGLFAALPVILSSLSGLLHPFMTRMQPEPAKLTFEQHLPALDHTLSPKGLFARNENTTVSDLRIVSLNGEVTIKKPSPDWRSGVTPALPMGSSWPMAIGQFGMRGVSGFGVVLEIRSQARIKECNPADTHVEPCEFSVTIQAAN